MIAASTAINESAREKVAMSVLDAPGNGVSLNVALTMAARLPNEPLTSFPRS